MVKTNVNTRFELQTPRKWLTLEWNWNGNGNGNGFRHKSNGSLEISCYLLKFNSIFLFYLFTNSDSFSIARIAALKASITSRYYHIGFISHTLYLQKRFLFVLWIHICKMFSLLRRIWFIFVVVAQHFQTKQNIQCYRRNIQSNMETKRNYIQYLFVIYWLCEFRERERKEKKNAKFCNQDRFHESFSLYFGCLPQTVQTLLMIAATQSILRCHCSVKYFRFATIYLTFICRLFYFFFCRLFLLRFFFRCEFRYSEPTVQNFAQICAPLLKSWMKNVEMSNHWTLCIVWMVCDENHCVFVYWLLYSVVCFLWNDRFVPISLLICFRLWFCGMNKNHCASKNAILW